MKITICGSQTFCKEMEGARKYLEEKGHNVYTPELLVTEEWFQEKNSKEELLKMKPIWTKSHFSKIQNSDAILILNNTKNDIPGYFGSNTLMELSVAFFLNKRIFLLNPINDSHPHFEELAGMDTIILNGNLDIIQ